MTYEPVDLWVKDIGVGTPALSGVYIKVLSENGGMLHGDGFTDAEGHLGLLLPPGRYQARFFRTHTRFTQPVGLEVVEGGTNVWDITGESWALPAALDSRLCRVSGYLRDAAGRPVAGRRVNFTPYTSQLPRKVDGAAVLVDVVEAVSDREGLLDVSLWRGQCYEARVFVSDEQLTRGIRVPDRAAYLFSDLLFSRPEVVTLAPAGPFALGVNAQLEVEVTVTYTDLHTETPGNDVVFTSSDPAVLDVQFNSYGGLLLRGVGQGTASIVATRRDPSLQHIPDTPIQLVNATVAVGGG